jgi:hypothetical protein
MLFELSTKPSLSEQLLQSICTRKWTFYIRAFFSKNARIDDQKEPCQFMKLLLLALAVIVNLNAAETPQFPKLIFAKMSVRTPSHSTVAVTNTSLSISAPMKTPSVETNHFRSEVSLTIPEDLTMWDKMDFTTDALGGRRMAVDQWEFYWKYSNHGRWVWGPTILSWYPISNNGPARDSVGAGFYFRYYFKK